MSIKWRMSLLIGVLLLLMVGINTYLMQSEQIKKSEQTQRVIGEIDKASRDNARKTVEELSVNMANQIGSLEQEIEKGMLNSALTLQQVDSTRYLRNEDLAKLAAETGMNDLYLTDRKGVFVTSTEKAALGMNLFDIWDGYKALLTGDAQVLPSDLKIKQETGEIFKFMAIPRRYGKGIIESAVNAKSVEQALSTVVGYQNGVQGIYLIDANNLVLTETLRQGQASLMSKGKTAANDAAKSVFQTGNLQVSIGTDGMADVYAPVRSQDKVRYVLYTRIDSTGYLLNAAMTTQSLVESDQQLSAAITKMIMVNAGLGALILLLFIIRIHLNFRPLSTMTRLAERMAAGDMTLDEIPIRRRDEIGVLATSFNRMAGNLRALIHEVEDSSKRLKVAAAELSAGTSQTGLAAEQIASSVERVASAADYQVRQAEEGTLTIRRLNDDVQKIATRAQSVTEVAVTALEQAADGNLAINSAVKQIDSINQTLLQLSTSIRGLGDQSQQIGHFVEGIKNIAAQTNLLAINATIEAAKAGEHGQGFSVVAAEVRHLAEQAVRSAQEITQLSTMIQAETNKAVHSMEATSQEVAGGIRVVNVAGVSFEQIRQAIEQIAEQIGQVSQSTAEMADDTKQIEQSMEQMSSEVEKTAFGTQNISAATEEQLAAMQEIGSSADVLTEMADELQGMIATFKTHRTEESK